MLCSCDWVLMSITCVNHFVIYEIWQFRIWCANCDFWFCKNWNDFPSSHGMWLLNTLCRKIAVFCEHDERVPSQFMSSFTLGSIYLQPYKLYYCSIVLRGAFGYTLVIPYIGYLDNKYGTVNSRSLSIVWQLRPKTN